MERAELTLELELALGIQPKVQERATHHQEEHILALDDGHTSLIERIQREDHDCQDHESRRQRPGHHVDRQFVYKGRLCWCYFYFFLHSHPERLRWEARSIAGQSNATDCAYPHSSSP